PIPKFVEELDQNTGPIVIGLKVNPERLVEIRRQRLLALNETSQTDYADEDAVRAEVTEANRLFQRNKWKTIDVSRRSVEETAAAILNHLSAHRK
ncbi:MAG: kinase/pyrophosphorylase, partial [Pseudomonadota bacterium]